MALSIQTTTRSDLQCAPDTVGFYCDYTGAGFTTVGPSGAETYDARMCELIHIWSFGDATGVKAEDMYQYPTRNPKQHLRRSVDKGHFVAHVFQRPGIFTVKVTVIEPSTGTVARASLMITVVDPNSVYADADTILVNNVGDADFSEGLALWPDADTLNVDSLLSTDAAWTSRQGGNPKRWLCKRGGQWTVGLGFDGSAGDNPFFGAYGSGAKPIWNPPLAGVNSNRCISVGSTWQSGTVPDMRIKNIRCEGGYDSTLYPCKGNVYDSVALWGHTFFYSQKGMTTVLTGCEMSGLARTNIFPNGQSGVRNQVHIDDCKADNMGGQYVVIGAGYTTTGTYFAASGNAFKNPTGSVFSRYATDSYGSNGDGGTRAMIRLEDWLNTYIAKNDFAHMEQAQPTLKLMNSCSGDGHIANVHSNVMENAGQQHILVGSNTWTTINRSFGVNIVVDANLFIGGCQIAQAMHTFASGVQFRNNLLVVPATDRPYYDAGDGNGLKYHGSGFNAFVAVATLNATVSAENAAAPIWVFSNTMLVLRSSAENNSEIIADKSVLGSDFTNILAENNIRHIPNYTSPHIPYDPLTEDVLCQGVNTTGMVHCDTLDVWPNTAIPVDSILDSKPGSGSAAIAGYVSGKVGRYDIIGRRHAATPNLGCWR